MVEHHVRITFPMVPSVFTQVMVATPDAKLIGAGRISVDDEGPHVLLAIRCGPVPEGLQESLIEYLDSRIDVGSSTITDDHVTTTGIMAPGDLEHQAFRFLAGLPGIVEPFTARIQGDTAEVFIPVIDMDQEAGIQRTIQKRFRDMGVQATMDVVEAVPEEALALRDAIPAVPA